MLNPIADRIERYMDLLAVRQRLTAANVANADTPGYRTKDINFQSELSSATGDAPLVIEPTGLLTKNDGNNVSLDREARLLAENALRFQIATQMLSNQVRAVRSAIQEGSNA